MNTLSYLSVMSQSLVRYDMANEMLNWAAAMSETKLKKMNFRQMKKFLQNKGWEYERPYPYKGRLCCTVSLLDIVRGEESKKFMERHAEMNFEPIKTQHNEQMVGRLKPVMDEDVCHMYLTPIMPLDIPNHNGRIYPVPKDILPEVITPLSYYGNCTKLEQEEDLPVHDVKVTGLGKTGELFSEMLHPRMGDVKCTTVVEPGAFEGSITNSPNIKATLLDRDVEHAYLYGSAFPTEPEHFQGANKMVSDIVEGKIEGNPLDLYGIVTRPYQAQLVSDMRRQTSIENPINDKILMSNSLKTTLGVVAEHKDKDIDILFSLKSLAARHPDLDPMDLKLSCGEIEGLTDEAKGKVLGLAAKYFAENFNLNEALKGVELMPGYSLSAIPKDETNDR